MNVRLAIIACLALANGASIAAGSGGESSDVFAGTLAQSIAAGIVFLLLLLILTKFAWGPILKGLQDRENKIKADLEQAEAAAKKATATLEQYHQELAQAKDQAKQIIEQGRLDAQKIASQLQEQAQAEMQQSRQRAQDEIETAKQQALNELYTQAATMATTIAGRILQRQVNDQDHTRLIEESLAQITKHQN